eukprot:scaffold1559_cov689-Prasinococcus_capsulatus_cf.AAC.1
MPRLQQNKVPSNEIAATGALLTPAAAQALPFGKADAVASAAVQRADLYSLELNQAQIEEVREHLEDLVVEIEAESLDEPDIELDLRGCDSVGEDCHEEVYGSFARR